MTTGETPTRPTAVVLGIDTATDVRVGLARGGVVLVADAVTDTRAHAEQLLPLVSRVLASAGLGVADVSAVVVGVGPGPFTGLRVGVAAARAFAFARQLPVTGACSLDVVAADWVRRGDAGSDFVIAVDARRKEVYWARYAGDGSRREGPFVTAPDQVPAVPLGGPGAALTGREVVGPTVIDAGVLAVAGLPDAGLEPLYLRRPDAEVPTARKSTLLAPRLAMVEPR